jgi:hypothetical protein
MTIFSFFSLLFGTRNANPLLGLQHVSPPPNTLFLIGRRAVTVIGYKKNTINIKEIDHPHDCDM